MKDKMIISYLYIGFAYLTMVLSSNYTIDEYKNQLNHDRIKTKINISDRRNFINHSYNNDNGYDNENSKDNAAQDKNKENIWFKMNRSNNENNILLQSSSNDFDEIYEIKQYNQNMVEIKQKQQQQQYKFLSQKQRENDSIIFSFKIKDMNKNGLYDGQNLFMIIGRNKLKVYLKEINNQVQLIVELFNQQINFVFDEIKDQIITVQFKQQKINSKLLEIQIYSNDRLFKVEEIKEINNSLSLDDKNSLIINSLILDESIIIFNSEIFDNHKTKNKKNVFEDCLMIINKIKNKNKISCLIQMQKAQQDNVQQIQNQVDEDGEEIKQGQIIQGKKNSKSRNLASINYITGERMRSLVRTKYENSYFKINVGGGTDINIRLGGYVYIGYFKLNQIVSGNQYLPLITLSSSVQSDYYIVFNLYIVDDTTVELKYTHDTENRVSKITQNVPNLQNTWMALGFGHTDPRLRLIFQATPGNAQLSATTEILTANFPDSIGDSWNVCITCQIEGNIYGKFQGQVSTVKFIQGVELNNINSFSYYNEDNMNRSKILSSSFSLTTYVIDSEYDLETGSTCQAGYFVEGVCITRCNEVYPGYDAYQAFTGRKYIDSTNNLCRSCYNNCLICDEINCTQCRDGYQLLNGKCIKYTDINQFQSATCSVLTPFDPMNQLCSQDINPSVQILKPQLLSSKIFLENTEVNVSPSLQTSEQITLCYIDDDNNKINLYSFVGGVNFSVSTKVTKSWAKVPQGYKKTVQFYVLFYGNGNPTNLVVKINDQIADLNSSFKTIQLNKVSCSGSSTLTQSIYQVEFNVNDYQTSFNLVIQSTSEKWGVRNIYTEVSKCHPTCGSCLKGGSASDCTSCSGSDFIMNNSECVCKDPTKFLKYTPCFDSPCVTCISCSTSQANCLKCESLTGKCIQCSSSYIVKDGVCVQDTSCVAANNDEKFGNFCGIRSEPGFNHLINNKIIQYADYWKFTNSSASWPSTCFSKQYAPFLGNGNMHTLQMQLPNYQSYHYLKFMKIDILAKDYIDIFDIIKIYDDNDQLYSQSYIFNPISNLLSLINGDGCGHMFPDSYKLEQISFKKNSNSIFLKIQSLTNSSLDDEAYSFTSLQVFYERCHPLCKDCTDKSEDKCINCIDNASVKNTKCQCNDGYYFLLERNPLNNNLPGLCQKCSISCKTCNGSSYQDCTSCADGYTFQTENSIQICKFNCKADEYWDNTTQICKGCHGCCQTCYNSETKNCNTCSSQMNLNILDNSCYFTSLNSQCQLCSIITNDYCGGNQQIHLDCISKGWIIHKTLGICLNCGDFVNGNCGGDQSQEVINFCDQNGFEQYNNNKCQNCSIANGDDCGTPEVKDVCKQNGWIKLNQNNCINCSPNSPTLDQCVCHSSCSTCNQPFSSTACTSCKSPLYLNNNQCLPNCPNSYKKEQQNCVSCSELEMPKCVNCFKTCLTCSTSVPSEINNTCTSCSTLTRQLVNSECKCQDAEDTRENFFECSYLDIAVLDIIISKNDPSLQINFGKQLDIPPNFNADTLSIALCKYLFDDKTLLLIKDTAQCSISANLIKIIFDPDAQIMSGDFMYFNKDVLSFSNPTSTVIKTFLNNVVVQEKLDGVSQVVYNYLEQQNSCNDVTLTFVQFINTGQREFHTFQWKLASITPSSAEEQELVKSILDKATTEKNKNIFIPKGIIKTGMAVTIQLDYLLKVNIQSSIQFPLSLKVEKLISLDIQSPIVFPFYRFQSGLISILSSVKICYASGDVSLIEPIKLKITSTEYPDANYQNSNYNTSEYIIQFSSYQLPLKDITFNIEAILISDQTIKASNSYVLPVSQPPLFVKLVGATGSGYYSYANKLELVCMVRDYDIEKESDPQGIDISWTCKDPATQLLCRDSQNQLVAFPSNQLTATVPADTFNPYTIVQIQVNGSKPVDRNNFDSIIIVFSELDLPPLSVDIKTNDIFKPTVNLNEELLVKLNYSSQVDIDTLSFSGTIIYEKNIVGVIKFDYTTLKFQLWNYYNGFTRDSTKLQLRFSVFNPRYYMPSSQLITLDINFPPKNCQFNVALLSPVAYSLETKFLLEMENCFDENSPLQYQFFFYQSEADFEHEKQYPLQVKRCQITDKQNKNYVNTMLPPGKIVLLAQAIDTKNAIYNATYPVDVQKKPYTESEYTTLIQILLDSMASASPASILSDLSILSYDIAERTEFSTSTLLNSKKIEIIDQLKTESQSLSTLSSFVVNINKAIAKLNQSGISYSSQQTNTIIDDLFTSLDDAYNDNSLNTELAKEKLKQKLYDSFLVLDSFSNSKSISSQNIQDKQGQEKLIQLQEKIGLYIFKNLIPNEDPVVFKGKQSSITSTQVTKKYLCQYFICESMQDGVYNRLLKQHNNATNRLLKEDDSSQNIYNFKMLTQNENPYQYDPTFLNYTQSLKNADPNLKLSSYPVITPSVNNQNNQEITTFDNKIAIQFSGQPLATQKKMACLSKNEKSEWTKDNCQSVYNKKKNTYSCVCSTLSSTTLVDDLEDILKNNKLVSTALTTDGFNNISNFSDFYNYVVFWLLSIQTFAFIFLFLHGRTQDKFDYKHKTNSLQLLTIIKSNNSVILKKGQQKIIRLKNNLTSFNQIDMNNQQPKTNAKLKHETSIEIQTNQEKVKSGGDIEENNLKLGTETIFQQHLKLNQNQHNYKTNNNLISSKQNINDQNLLHIKINNTNESTPNNINSEFNSARSKIFKNEIFTANKLNIIQINQKISSNENLQSSKVIYSQNSDEQQQQIDKKIHKPHPLENDQKVYQPEIFKNYQSLPIYKQILLFHNFFGIFYIFNPFIPRGLRFLIFYVRSIHTLAIAVIFDQSYTLAQRTMISIINAISLLIIVKLLEKIFVFNTRIGKIISGTVIITILLGYYYIILSIVSGEEPNKSNVVIGTFALLYAIDLLFISFLSAMLQRNLANFILKNQKFTGCFSFFYKAIELQLILTSLQ